VSEFLAGAGAFLGINGLSQLVYRVWFECVERTALGCTNRAGGSGEFVGKWSEGGFITFWLVVSLLCSGLAIAIARAKGG
jgi:hypothetical protein